MVGTESNIAITEARPRGRVRSGSANAIEGSRQATRIQRQT
jgi:hypothetical protein